MKSYEAIKRLVRDKAKLFGDRLILSGSTIYKWTEESAHTCEPGMQPSGLRNPLDIIEQMIEIGIAFDVSSDDCVAPIQYLAERFSLILIPSPHGMPGPKELMQGLMKTIQEFADLTKATGEALEDGTIRRPEARRVEKEGNDLIRQVAALIVKVKEAASR